MMKLIIRAVGLGIAVISMLWILAHLIAFSAFPYIIVGEPNPIILLAEIALITSGLACFIADLLMKR